MNARTLICTIAGLLAVALLVALTPRSTLLPKGIVLPAQQVRTAISSGEVALYSEAPKENFVRLGKVSVEQGFDVLNAETKEMLISKVKEMAAKIGANGVIVDLLMPSSGVRKMLVFRGTAIYISSPVVRSKQ